MIGTASRSVFARNSLGTHRGGAPHPRVMMGKRFAEASWSEPAPSELQSIRAKVTAALDGLARLRENEPDLAFQLLHDIARVLSQRLRARGKA
jgi:hypothetical protein